MSLRSLWRIELAEGLMKKAEEERLAPPDHLEAGVDHAPRPYDVVAYAPAQVDSHDVYPHWQEPLAQPREDVVDERLPLGLELSEGRGDEDPYHAFFGVQSF
jgi:hypothetical protein